MDEETLGASRDVTSLVATRSMAYLRGRIRIEAPRTLHVRQTVQNFVGRIRNCRSHV